MALNNCDGERACQRVGISRCNLLPIAEKEESYWMVTLVGYIMLACHSPVVTFTAQEANEIINTLCTGYSDELLHNMRFFCFCMHIVTFLMLLCTSSTK